MTSIKVLMKSTDVKDSSEFALGITMQETSKATYMSLISQAGEAAEANSELRGNSSYDVFVPEQSVYANYLDNYNIYHDVALQSYQSAEPAESSLSFKNDLVHYDELTGLFNRNSYVKYLNELSVEALSSMGVLSTDINGLKVRNHEFGSEYGDAMLIFVADTLSTVFGKIRIFRISGDEFVVFDENVTHSAFLEKVNLFRETLNLSYPDGVSIGYTWSDNDIKPKELTAHADALMKLEKQDYYRRAEENGDRDRPEFLKSLLQAINDEHFQVYLQPKANIDNGTVISAEALVRCNDPVQGLMTPDKFVPVLEKQNLIQHIDFFVLDEVLSTISKWRMQGRRVIPISVNFSRSTLLNPNSFPALLELMKQYDVPPDYIEIEITETLGAVERATVSRVCMEYIRNGIHLSLDDFGSDYSSLSILSAIPFSELKMDKSLINNIVSNKASYLIAENTIRMCNELSMNCVAEGVETKGQLDILKKIGCHTAQGYYFNKPIPIEEFEKKYMTVSENVDFTLD